MRSKRLHAGGAEPRKSLAIKLTRVTMLILLGLGGANLFLVHRMNQEAANHNLSEIEKRIQSGLDEKGRLLTENHSLAMKTMVPDNAFGDVRALVNRAIREDGDLVYGLFLDEHSKPWVYASPTSGPSADDRPNDVDSEAWRELGIGEEILEGLAQRRVSLFGQEIHEFAMPVIVDEENLGTLRYGISTAQMKQAVSAAQERSQDATSRQLRILLALVLATTFLGIVIIRKQAIRVTRPLGALTLAANRLAAGDRDVYVSVDSGDEVEVLAAAFNKMAAELNASYLSLESLNQELEGRVVERTRALAARNRDMQKVFENVEQGFITLCRDGVMAPERSSVVDQWFGSFDAPTSFVDLMARTNLAFAEYFEVAWDQLNDGFLPAELCLSLLPTELSIAERHFSVSYSFLATDEGQEDEWSGVLVVIADISEQLALDSAEQAQREFAHAVRSVFIDRNGYLGFVEETARLVEIIGAGRYDDDPAVFKRAVHTVKGNAGGYHLKSIADICHEIEEAERELCGQPPLLARQRLEGRWNEFLASINFLLVEQGTEGISVADDVYDKHLGEIFVESTKDAFDRVFSWQLEPASYALERLATQARTYAERLGKADVDIVIEAGGERLDSAYWRPLWSEFTHVVRNAVDHGLPSDVDAGGRRSKLTFRSLENEDSFVVEIEDNGRGIDWDKVAARARAKHLPHATRADLVEALYHDGLSSLDTASTFSGRGVGMGAVREQVTRMNGKIEIRSSPGEGTCCRFTFPRSQMYGALYARCVERFSRSPAELVCATQA